MSSAWHIHARTLQPLKVKKQLLIANAKVVATSSILLACSVACGNCCWAVIGQYQSRVRIMNNISTGIIYTLHVLHAYLHVSAYAAAMYSWNSSLAIYRAIQKLLYLYPIAMATSWLLVGYICDSYLHVTSDGFRDIFRVHGYMRAKVNSPPNRHGQWGIWNSYSPWTLTSSMIYARI